jgi:DNA polymerase III alpha subunit
MPRPTACARSSPKKTGSGSLADFHAPLHDRQPLPGVSPDQAAAVWQMMMSFSGYSFCKPHSASYARVSFQAAYLKTHHPAEFMAGVISNQGGFYSTFAYVSEARRMGWSVDPPDVTPAGSAGPAANRHLQVGLMAVGGMSGPPWNRIVACRAAVRFQGHDRFSRPRAAHEDEARALIHCGALDRLDAGRSRARLLWTLAIWQAGQRRSTGSRRTCSQAGGSGLPETPPTFPPEDPPRRLRREFAVLGFLCRQHPITLFAEVINPLHTVKAVRLPDLVGRRVRLAAWLITGKVVHTRTGTPWNF